MQTPCRRRAIYAMRSQQAQQAASEPQQPEAALHQVPAAEPAPEVLTPARKKPGPKPGFKRNK